MNKKVSLLELVGIKIVYALLIVVYYWMFARRDWHDYYSTIQYVIAIFTICFFLYQYVRIKKFHQESVDELAYQNLNRANSICLKIAVVAIVAIAFSGAMEFVGNLAMGYLLVLTLLILSVLRTIVFYIMDSKGV